jgi:transcriptional regulator with XRE-family HTH domain
MSKRGYTRKMKAIVSNPDNKGLGVELGRLCILHGYSVVELAEVFGITRATAYNWITGRSKPSKHLIPQVTALVERLRQKPVAEQYENE